MKSNNRFDAAIDEYGDNEVAPVDVLPEICQVFKYAASQCSNTGFQLAECQRAIADPDGDSIRLAEGVVMQADRGIMKTIRRSNHSES